MTHLSIYDGADGEDQAAIEAGTESISSQLASSEMGPSRLMET